MVHPPLGRRGTPRVHRHAVCRRVQGVEHVVLPRRVVGLGQLEVVVEVVGIVHRVQAIHARVGRRDERVDGVGRVWRRWPVGAQRRERRLALVSATNRPRCQVGVVRGVPILHAVGVCKQGRVGEQRMRGPR
jgi:hypothetical protein